MTIVDTSLAAALHLNAHGEAQIFGVGFHDLASMSQLDLLEAGSHGLTNQMVLVHPLQKLHSADLDIQGVLGEDFLEHFDVLIDNDHRLLCLDDSVIMRAAIRGTHIALADSVDAEGGAQPKLLIVEARLSDGMRPVRLMLDSGANVPLLYNALQYMYNASLYVALHPLQNTKFRGSGLDGEPLSISDLPAQGMKIGSLRLSKVKFLTIDVAQNSSRSGKFDGLLTMRLFHRVFIDHVDRVVVLDPRKEYEY